MEEPLDGQNEFVRRRCMEALFRFSAFASARAVKRISKATLYKSGMFGVSALEVHDLAIDIAPYAQYSRALHVSYRRPRARKRVGFVSYSAGDVSPGVWVLEGWGHPRLVADPMTKGVNVDGVIRSESRHTCYSPEYEREFQASFSAYCASAPKVRAHDFSAHREWKR